MRFIWLSTRSAASLSDSTNDMAPMRSAYRPRFCAHGGQLARTWGQLGTACVTTQMETKARSVCTHRPDVEGCACCPNHRSSRCPPCCTTAPQQTRCRGRQSSGARTHPPPGCPWQSPEMNDGRWGGLVGQGMVPARMAWLHRCTARFDRQTQRHAT